MQPRFLLFPLLVLLLPPPGAVRAEASAPSGGGHCVAASVEARPASAAGSLHRIVFVNQCEQPRSFFWCAEHPAETVPPELACPRAGMDGMFPVESHHSIQRRREFQWYLPAGTRIRFHDCPGPELPTSDFGCMPAAATGTPRR